MQNNFLTWADTLSDNDNVKQSFTTAYVSLCSGRLAFVC